MELWAQFAHKALWHDFEPGWKLHKSHHVPRVGPFEDNDVFAIANAVPAMGLCLYGFLTPNVSGGELQALPAFDFMPAAASADVSVMASRGEAARVSPTGAAEGGDTPRRALEERTAAVSTVQGDQTWRSNRLTPPAAGLCFGAGLGITLFGISYMFIHDGLVHRRFPVGPIAEVSVLLPLSRRWKNEATLDRTSTFGTTTVPADSQAECV